MVEKKIQQYKLDAVEELKSAFEEIKDFIFTDYRGLSVDQITSLRRKLKEQDADYKVIKNRFAKIAFHQMEKTGFDDQLIGPTAIAMARDEAGPIAKTLFEFEKETSLNIKGGLIGGNVFSREDVEAFSKLPGREELLAMLMGTMNSPVRNLMYAMNGVAQKLVRVLKAVEEQKQQAG
jgi:large subunit ribosomal protein L10